MVKRTEHRSLARIDAMLDEQDRLLDELTETLTQLQCAVAKIEQILKDRHLP